MQEIEFSSFFFCIPQLHLWGEIFAKLLSQQDALYQCWRMSSPPSSSAFPNYISGVRFLQNCFPSKTPYTNAGDWVLLLLLLHSPTTSLGWDFCKIAFPARRLIPMLEIEFSSFFFCIPQLHLWGEIFAKLLSQQDALYQCRRLSSPPSSSAFPNYISGVRFLQNCFPSKTPYTNAGDWVLLLLLLRSPTTSLGWDFCKIAFPARRLIPMLEMEFSSFFFCVPQLHLWGEIFAYVTVFCTNHWGSHIPSLWTVHAECVFVAGIHPSRTLCQDLLSLCDGMNVYTD